MITPFPYETFAPKEYFYGRDEELKILKQYITNSSNVLLFSKRRMGKSSLIKNLFEDIKKEFITIYIDVYNIIDAEDFGKILLNGILEAQKSQKDFDIIKSIKKISSYFRKARIEPTFDPQSGEMGMRLVSNDLNFEELIDESFQVLFSMAKDKSIVLAIDEFQQISNIKDVKIDAILRKYIQEAKNISYIFLGSKRNILNSLFAYKAPLYSMATPMVLNALKTEDIYNYTKKYIDISYECIEYIYNISEKETKLIQNILHRIYIDEKNIKEINTQLIDLIVNDIIISCDQYYKTLFEQFSTNQKKAFKILSYYNKEIYSDSVLMNEKISKSSMQSSLNQLYNKEYIDKEDGKYFIPDRTFELWAKSRL
jgi:hypothetical protein